MVLAKTLLYSSAVFCFLYFACKKKDSEVLFKMIMVFCWVVIALSMDSHDISNYREVYDAGYLRSKGILYDFFQEAFSNAGISFDVFKVIYGTVIWLLLYRALKNFTVDTALVAALFVLGPMMGFGTQMRSSMAGAIVLNALPLLLEKDVKVWKYCVLIAVASMFHLMAAFYFIFLIPKFIRINSEKFRNICVTVALLLIPFFFVFSGVISELCGYLQTLTDISVVNVVLSRFQQYFSGQMSPNIKGFLFGCGSHFVVFVLTDFACSVMLGFRKAGTNDNEEHRMLSSHSIEYLRKLNSIMALIMPCYILSLQFDRFHNYFVPVCYCLIVQGAREIKLENKVSNVGNIMLFLLLACMIFCFFVGNWYSGYAEYSRIVSGIGMFGG